MASETWRFGVFVLLILATSAYGQIVTLSNTATYYSVINVPFEVTIDRSKCPVEKPQDAPSGFKKSCFCFTTDNMGFSDAGCGNGFASICSTTKLSNFAVWPAGQLASFVTKKLDYTAAMKIELKVCENRIFKAVNFKSAPADDCAVVTVNNVGIPAEVKDESTYQLPPCPPCKKAEECKETSQGPPPDEPLQP